MSRTELPPSNLPDGMVLTDFDGYEVASWSPGKVEENVPPTQVHLILRRTWDRKHVFALRLKSARAVDELIDTLQEHRDFTYGKRTP